jgi:hypothetical protein
MNMRPDQIQDFFKNFLRHLQYEGELPTELREQLHGATQVGLLTSPTLFVIRFLDSNHHPVAYQYKIRDPNTPAPEVERAQGNWELVPE